MVITSLPKIWDAKKFAARYQLDVNRDFYVTGDGKLVVFPALPDNPPIFDPPDPPPATITSLINALPSTVPQAVKDILLRLAQGR